MATGMREKTTNVGGVIKRIWYAMTGVVQGAELASLDDTGKFKCVSEQISGLAGVGARIVQALSDGTISAGGLFTYQNTVYITAGTPVAIGDTGTFRASTIYTVSVAGSTAGIATEYKRIMVHVNSGGEPYFRTIISGGSGTITIGVSGSRFTINSTISGEYIVSLNNL